LIAGALVIIATIDASFVGGWRPLDGGDDGLFYEGVGRNIAQYLVAGDVWHALEGGEKVFYYGGPGLRYLRAIELFAFGDTNLGYLSLVLFMPILVLAIYRRFLPARWALALVLVFVLVPLGALFGSSFLNYAGLASRGYADAAAQICCLSGLLLLVGVRSAGPDARLAPAFGAALLMALGVVIKPVIAPFVAVLLAGAGLAGLSRRQWARVAGLCLGFLPVTLMPLHNWVFGGKVVLASANAANAELLIMPPSAWAAAGAELLRMDLGGEHVRRAVLQVAHWLAGPSESLAMIPLHAAAIVPLVWVAACGRGYDPWLRLIAAATLAEHAVAFFYAPAPRYYYMTWFATALVCAVWLRSTGFDLLRARWPDACAAVARQPLNRRLSAMLAALQKWTGYADEQQPAPGRSGS
jgi:hypothetical protein